jgi:hypothetical protein
MNTYANFLLYLAQLFLARETLRTEVVEKIKIHTVCSTNFFFFSKIVPFMR